jgi:hypothetical protein
VSLQAMKNAEKFILNELYGHVKQLNVNSAYFKSHSWMLWMLFAPLYRDLGGEKGVN